MDGYALSPEMQNNAARITGIRAGDWMAYDNAPDSEDGIMGMIWLCLAYLEGLPEAHTTGRTPAKMCAVHTRASRRQSKNWIHAGRR